MDRYRYFIFNQRSMVVLGILQIACTGVLVVCGFMDGTFRKESTLAKTRAPIWAGMIMAVPGVLALFSSQKKNPFLVNALIAASVFSCFSALIIIVYACITLAYGEDDDEVLSHTPVHIVHTMVIPSPYHQCFFLDKQSRAGTETARRKFILGQLVQGANIAMLVASFFSLCVVMCIAYIGCRSLPYCMCYDNITGMEWLHPDNEQPQTVELVCTFHGGDQVFNSPAPFTEGNVDAEEPFSHPPPYVRL